LEKEEKMKRSNTLVFILFLLMSFVALNLSLSSATAAEYPSKTIHLVVPWKAGGGTDSIGRGIAEAIKTVIDESVVVDNISGAGGVTGSIKVVQSKPDGYTLLMNGDTDMTAALTFKDLPLSLDDFVYIGGFFQSPTWVLAHKDRGYESLADYLSKAKQNPGKLTMGTAGPAGAQILMASAIKGISGADFRIIPYSGGKDLKKALIGNQVDAGIIHAPVLLAEVKEGFIDVLGTGKPLDKITYAKVRNTPTLKDINIPIEIGITRGIYAPKGLSKEVTEKLSIIVEKAAKSDSFKQFGERFGFLPIWVPGPEFEKQVKEELKLFKDIKAKYID
jgi:tripartite-type tricarboxylate transporter receptor subunit TctC